MKVLDAIDRAALNPPVAAYITELETIIAYHVNGASAEITNEQIYDFLTTMKVQLEDLLTFKAEVMEALEGIKHSPMMKALSSMSGVLGNRG